MSVKEKMTAIADAIREKTGGTATLTLDEMAEEIKGIGVKAPSFAYLVDTMHLSNDIE